MISVYNEATQNVYNPGTQVFTRSGSLFGVVAKPQRHTLVPEVGKWGSSDLYLAIGRGGAAALPSNLSLLFVPVHHGTMLPYAMESTPTEMKLRTAYGDVSFCFAEPNLLLIQGENDLELLIETDMVLHQFLRKRKENSWECPHSPACSFVFTGVRGEIEMDAKYDFQRLSHPTVRAVLKPEKDGKFLLAVEEFSHLGYTRESYPTYEEGLADAQADWDAYLQAMPAIPEFAAGRVPAAYLTWSLLAGPSVLMKRPQEFRQLGQGATAWQTCQNAAAVRGNLPLAADLLTGMLDHQSADGQIPLFSDDSRIFGQTVSAPLQGWALKYLMEKQDLSALSSEQLATLYDGFSKWVGWYDTCRDAGNGFPQYESPEECCFEDCPVFDSGNAVQLPDLCAFLALLEEALGDLAGKLGRCEESDRWYQRSKDRIAGMLETFWDGRRFVGRSPETDETFSCDSLVFYRPLILGNRLPAEVVDTLAADFSEAGGYLTKYGLNSCTGADGRVIPAENALIASGLLWAGKTELAREIAKRCCTGMLPADTSRGAFADSLAAADFQILAEIACGE